MQVIALSGSPRRKGNTAELARDVLHGAQGAGHETEFIQLAELDIRDCTGCMQCQDDGVEQCVICDDIRVVEDALESADVIVLASPVHWGNMSGIMLRTLERLFGFMIQEQKLGAPKKRRAKGKRAVLITSCSTPWPLNWVFNQTRAVFSRFKEVCRYSGLEIVDKVAAPGMFHSRDLSDKVRTRARKAGRRLRAS